VRTMAALIILIALLLGLLLGLAGSGTAWGDAVTAAADPIGGLWLNALKMTIVPLVVSLLVTGITKTAEAARAGKLAGRSVTWFLVLLWSSSIMAALVMPLLLDLWPLDPTAGTALKAALGEAAAVPPPPAFREFLLGLVPSNPIAAAANDAILPLTVFTTIFAFAMLKLPTSERDLLSRFFEALGNAMLVVIGWILWLAPIGVFALAFVVGARAGFSALGGLVHYVLIVSALGVIVWIAAYPLALIGGRVSLGRFVRAALPAQAVAISTQSSLASLPAMLKGSEALGIKPATADVVLPLAVALFRATGPAMNLAVAIYVAHWYGIALGPWQLAAGVAVAATTTLGAVSLPGQLSFISSIAPIALAMGVPFEPLALLIAVETIPDIFRTVGNVSMDMAVTATIAHRTPEGDAA
jgi:proton glutamate symport protein